jgi:hypothetical protein
MMKARGLSYQPRNISIISVIGSMICLPRSLTLVLCSNAYASPISFASENFAPMKLTPNLSYICQYVKVYGDNIYSRYTRCHERHATIVLYH